MKNKEKELKYSLIAAATVILILVFCGLGYRDTIKTEKKEKTDVVQELESSDVAEVEIQPEDSETTEGLEESEYAKEEVQLKESENEPEETVAEESKETEEKTVNEVEVNTETAKKEEPVREELENLEIRPIEIGDGFTVMTVQSYDGKYIEDGSDEQVQNVMAAYVKNNGTRNIQLADFKLFDTAGKVYEFRLTTLMPGQEMIVLEKNRAVYDEKKIVVSAELENLAVFSEEPQMCEDVLEIRIENNTFTVTNISDQKLLAARICYKNIYDGIYLGGITYTSTIPEIDPGETVELATRHYSEGASKVAFVTYAK